MIPENLHPVTSWTGSCFILQIYFRSIAIVKTLLQTVVLVKIRVFVMYFY